jgi:polynucleotide 5'-hydroxyl-kinase GRC3/NOL9
MDDAIHLPDEWVQAIESLHGRRRIAVIGATDVGKSSFVGALLACRPELALIDLDPGQKMVGPPGTVSLGRLDEEALTLERMLFIGSTSSASIYHLSRAAAALARAPSFVANTSGFVRGLGARLQAATISALEADRIVAIGPAEDLASILEAHPEVPVVAVPASPMARRKSPAFRAALRQAAFAEALAGAVEQVLELPFEPAPPVAVPGRHPVCALWDEEDMSLGILLDAGAAGALVAAPALPRPPRRIRLGKMWAEPTPGGWKLLETLSPCWRHD